MPVSSIIPVYREERSLSLLMPRLHPQTSESPASPGKLDARVSANTKRWVPYVASAIHEPQSIPDWGGARTLLAQ